MPAKRLAVVLLVLAGFIGLSLVSNRHPSYSANLTNASVTLANSRVSFRGALAGGNSVGSSTVIINTTTNAYPSTSTVQLVNGDIVLIGNAGSLASHTVATTSAASTFTISDTLASGDTEAGDDVIATQSGQVTVRFTTVSAIANGRFRVLVPAINDDGGAADGIPDGGKFDLATTTPTVTCPSNATATYDFYSVTNGNNGDATSSAVTIGGNQYHTFECAYSGTGATSTAFDGSSNDAIVISSLINPAPDTDHADGEADAYQIIVQHLDDSLAVQDSSSMSIGIIEAVRVNASVARQITFSVAAVNNSVSACGTPTDVTTTAAAVPFGTVSLLNFIDAAQTLSVSTNSITGYSVTALANDQLRHQDLIDASTACTGDPTDSGNTSCINDSRGDNGSMQYNAVDKWDNTSVKGFAYSLNDYDNTISNGNAEAFNYSDTSGNCSGGVYCARQFADDENSESATEIFGSNTVADSEYLYVCYRVIPSTVTEIGDYQNTITYTATATF